MRDGTAGQERELALSEVVGFVLLLGVLVAAMALWMMYIVPVTGREDEITHMNEVKDRFTEYKITLDSLWINSNNPSVASMAGVTTSTSFNLGTGGGNTQAGGMFISLMKPVASPAILALTNSGDWMNVTTTDNTGTVAHYDYSLSKIEYLSQNNYWIQQKYYYQSGGVFLEQESGSTTRVSPPISIINSSASATDAGAFTSSVVIAPITLDGGASIGGNGPVRLDSRLKNKPAVIGPAKTTDVRIDVYVPDHTTALMWKATFLDALSNGGVTDPAWYEVGNSTPGSSPSYAYVRIIGPFTDTTEDIWFTMHPAEFAVTFNNIATGIT
ncbi:MAG: hypothetical protein M0Q92_09365 [Methanoregula sp.]|jgi:hypothetical protein|nr:hypothetical protein [Methanoregula sp.]